MNQSPKGNYMNNTTKLNHTMLNTQTINPMGNLNLSDLYKQYANKQYIPADGPPGGMHYLPNGQRNINAQTQGSNSAV